MSNEPAIGTLHNRLGERIIRVLDGDAGADQHHVIALAHDEAIVNFGARHATRVEVLKKHTSSKSLLSSSIGWHANCPETD